MFPIYHRNLIKPKSNKISIFINVFVIFFSLNFNSFLFAPTFAEDGLPIETIVESTVSDIDIPVQEDPILEENVVQTNTTEESVSTEDVPLPDVENQDLTGEIIEDVLSGSSDFIDEVPVIPEIGPNLDEVLTGSLDSPLSGNLQEIVEEILEDQTHNAGGEDVLSGSINTGTQENIIQIDQVYFDFAFEKDVYNHKVFDLQNILISLGFFTGSLNGIYDDLVISAVYQYQLSKGIMMESDNPSLRGFFGPTTRQYFNDEYVVYKKTLLNGISNVFIGGGVTQNIITEKDKYAELISRVKEYFMQNRYSLENIFGSGVFVGNEDIDFSMLSGQILLPIIFQSTNTLDGNVAEVEFEPGTILRDENGVLFTGSLSSPEFLDESVADELSGHSVVSVLDVGGNDEKIVLEDSAGEKVLSKVKIPVPGQDEGSFLDINYSHDGEMWTYMTSQKVFLENGVPYIEFETSHFTLFSISLPVGTFFINNGAFSVNGTNVILNSNIPGASHMRFANTTGALTSASWVDYNTGYSWTILGSNGSNTVYAQFSGSYGIQSISDSIFLDNTTGTANLKISLNGLMNGTNVLDSTSNAYNFSGFGSITNPTVSGEQVLSFNGTSQYAQRTGIGLTAYPFTFSAWINTDTIAGTDSIVMVGNSGSTTVYRGIQLINGAPSIVARNTTSYAATPTIILNTGRRYHVVGVFASATDRRLYLDGNRVSTNTTSVAFSNTNQQFRVGRYVSTSTNYFDGYIDDVRVYTSALTTGEIQTMYNSRLKQSPPVQYLNAGSFSVNGDAPNTYSTGVILNSNVTGMSHMRFANTTGELTSAPWVGYATGYSWSLNGTTGNKIVYAQYSGVGGIWEAQDGIFLDPVNDVNLRILLSSAANGTRFLDSTVNAYHFTGFNGLASVPSPDNSSESVMSFNGTSQYAQRGTMGITAYPFTFSAWVNVKDLVGTDSIVSIGNSAATNSYYGIQLVNGAPSIVARNTTAQTTTSTYMLSTGVWHHIVGVFNSGTDKRLYVNGSRVGTNTTSVTFSSTNQIVRIGAYAASTLSSYFGGYIDDVRIYNKSLTTGEIDSLYRQRTSRIKAPSATIIYSNTLPTTDPVVATITGFSENGISIINNGGSNQYTFTGNGNFTFWFKDTDGNVGSAIAAVNRITTAGTGSLSLSGPASFSFGTAMVNSTVQSWTKTFTGLNDYFDVIDDVGGDAGYYTTLSFSDLQYNSSIISKNNIYVRAEGGITLRSGTANANVVTAITGSYLATSSPLTFIKRDAGSNGGKKGTYGARIGVKIDIPAFQQPGNYTGTIIYTLY